MKTIKKGECKGLTEITEAMIEKKSQDANTSMGIPTYTVPVVITKPMQQNCKGGDIDSCQNSGWCGQCIDARRAETAPVEKTIIGSQDLLDIPAYLEQAKIMN